LCHFLSVTCPCFSQKRENPFMEFPGRGRFQGHPRARKTSPQCMFPAVQARFAGFFPIIISASRSPLTGVPTSVSMSSSSTRRRIRGIVFDMVHPLPHSLSHSHTHTLSLSLSFNPSLPAFIPPFPIPLSLPLFSPHSLSFPSSALHSVPRTFLPNPKPQSLKTKTPNPETLKPYVCSLHPEPLRS
jgi:hypothetical protein